MSSGKGSRKKVFFSGRAKKAEFLFYGFPNVLIFGTQYAAKYCTVCPRSVDSKL